jgi:tripartite-type tricarboxylate transporter receptor subunit TctC
MQSNRPFRFAAAAIAAAALASGAPIAAAQQYPSKNVTLVVPYTAGGSSDLMSRTMAQHLSKEWNVNFVVENRAGASGMIGAEIVSKAEPDGYTMLGTTSSYTATAAIRKKLPFNPATAFMPVGTIARAPNLVAVHPSVPAKSIKELVALAKQYPNRFNYGSSGTGGNNHFAGALFGAAAGLKMVHVPYKGIANATTALASGEVELVISSSASLLAVINAKKVRILGVTSEGPSPHFPDLPVVGDSVPGYSYYLWWGIFVPAKTPADRVAFINAAFNKILATPEMKKFLTVQGAEPWPHSVAQLKDLLPGEIARYKKAMEVAGIKPQ